MDNLSILVVDDDPVIRRLLEQRLKKEDYTVAVAEDGHVAEHLLNESFYDVILTDLMMPGGIGGIEVLEIAKGLHPSCEVVLITAHSSVDSAVEAMKKGAVDYLEKPINFDELFLRLNKIKNVKGILKNALDLQQAMDVTEHTASETIQNLEILASQLQSLLDDVENILRTEGQDAEGRILEALNKIARL
jgi:two-component system, OmpR family, response regulator